MDLQLLNQISHFDLYFFSELITPYLAEPANGDVVHDAMSARFGSDWRAKLVDLDLRYHAGVKKLIAEKMESRQSSAALERLQLRTLKWRRAMLSFAALAESKVERKALEAAAGRGLGSPRGIKEQKDFWLLVSSKVEALRNRFIALGVSPDVLDIASTAQEELSALSAKVTKERAEDSSALTDIRMLQQELVEFFRILHFAVQGAYESALVLDDPENANAAQELSIRIDTSFDQARVRTYKQVEGSEASPEALLVPTAEPEGVLGERAV